MILMIDNYDSFTFNIVQYLNELGEKVEVLRNDEVKLSEIERLNPSGIVISPGPSTPDKAGISLSLCHTRKPDKREEPGTFRVKYIGGWRGRP